MPRIIRLDTLQQFAAINLSADQGAKPGKLKIPNAVLVQIKWQLQDGKAAFNNLYGIVGAGFTPTATIANLLMTQMTSGAPWSALAPFLATTTSFAGVILRDVRDVDLPFVPSSNAAVPGTGAGGELPDEVAAAVTLKTANVGPANRGRIYVPGFAITALAAGNVIAPGCVTALSNWVDNFRNIWTANQMTLALGLRERVAYTSDKTGAPFPARPAQAKPVTQAICRDNHWDTQRRRGLK